MTGKSRITALITGFEVDWPLLLFLLLFLNVKIVIKAAAIVFIYLYRFDLKFGFSLKNSRMPLFYLIMPAIATFNFIINPAIYSLPYTYAFVTGLLFWAACLLAIHQVKLSVESRRPETIYHTIVLFFIINAIVSVSQLAAIVWETGALNPYQYQGNYQKYFTSTGDYIKGVLFDSSPANAYLNAFGIVFFLFRVNITMTLLCTLILLLTGSNLANIMLLVIFIYLSIFQSSRIQKSLMVCCTLLITVFLAKISPQNMGYIRESYEKALGIKQKPAPSPSNALRKEIPETAMARLFPPGITVWFPSLPKENIHAPFYQYRNDTTPQQQALLSYIKKHSEQLPLSADSGRVLKLPGKLIAMQQTFQYFRDHPAKAIAGAGMGNFSSKLAFRVSGLHIAGGFPAGKSHINKDFLQNHLDLYLYYFSKDAKFQSVINLPQAVFDQVIAEYGMTGLISLVVFYLGFFAKQGNRLTYGVPLLLLLAGIFFTDYWFEQLSVIVFFELLLLLNIKEHRPISGSLI